MENNSISIYSSIMAIIFFNLFLLVIAFLRRNTMFLVKNSTTMLLLVLLLGIIRLFIPLDIPSAAVIQSTRVIPRIQYLLGEQLFGEITLGMLLGFIWILGVVLTLIRAFVNLILEVQRMQKYKIVDDSEVIRVAKELNLKNIVILVSPDVDVPKVIGIFKAYIYLPLLVLSDEELKLVLCHEYQHFKGKDFLIEIFYLILSALFWWNPVIHIFQREIDNLLELRCDATITKKMDNDERIAYLNTILNVIKQTVWRKEKFLERASKLVNQNNEGFIQQRFEVVLYENKYKTSKIKLVTFLAIVIVFLLSYFVIIQPAYYPPESDLEGQIEITTENAFILVLQDGTMKLFVNEQFHDTIAEKELKSKPYSDLKIIEKGN